MKNVCDLLTVVYLKCHNCPHIESLMCVPRVQAMLATWGVYVNTCAWKNFNEYNCFLQIEYLNRFRIDHTV